MAAAGADEPLHEARRQVVEPRRLGVGHARQGVQPREQVAGGPLLERGQGTVAVGGTEATQGLAGPLQVPGRPQAAGPLRRLALGPGERLAEGVEPVDGDLRGPLGQGREPAADPLDDRPFQVLVGREERRDLVDPLHARQGLELLLAGEQLLARVGDREGVPHALVALLEQLLLHRHALETLGLEVQEVVVVVELVEPAGEGHRARQRRQGHEPRVAHEGPQPGVHRHRLGDAAAEWAAVHERHHGGEHEQLGGAAQEDAAAGDEAELGDAHETRQRRAEEGHRGGDRAGEDARADRAARLQEGGLAGAAGAAQLQVAADVVGAVVDADADHGDREGHAEDVEVADARRRPAERPRHADHEHAVGHQGVADAAEAGDDHDHDRGQRQAAGPEHRLLARPHLVVFHHRQPGEADRGLRVPPAHGADDPPQFVGGGRRAGEAALLLHQP